MLNIEDYMEEAKFAAEIAYNSTILKMGLYNSLDEEYLLSEGIGDKMKELFGKFKEWVKKAFNKVIEFFKNIIAKIKQKFSKKKSAKSSAKKKGEQKKKEESKKKIIHDYSEVLKIVNDLAIDNANPMMDKYIKSIRSVTSWIKNRTDNYTNREDNGRTLPYGKKHDEDDGKTYIDYEKEDGKRGNEDLKNVIQDSIPGSTKEEKILNIMKACYKGSSTIFTSANMKDVVNNIVGHVKTIEVEKPDETFMQKQKAILIELFRLTPNRLDLTDNEFIDFLEDIINGLEDSRDNVCKWAEMYGKVYKPENEEDKKELSDAHKFFVTLQNSLTEAINSVVFVYKLFMKAFGNVIGIGNVLDNWIESMAIKDGIDLPITTVEVDDDFFDD